MWFCFARRRRRSLRGRLALNFVLLSLGTLILAFGLMMYHNPARQGNPRYLFPVLAGFAAGLGVLTAGAIVRRLDRLGKAVERLDLRDLSLRVPVEGDDEISALARSFNRMVDRLAAEERVRRELFADVAHELRHPLAVLKGRLDMMQDGLVPLDPEQVLYLQDAVIALTRLVGDVRDLSLAEVDRLSLHMATINPAELIEGVLENMEPVAADRGIQLAADVPAELPSITADADRIRQVLLNLLTNALHHTPAGGRVEVRAKADADRLVMQVADTGAGIPAEDLPYIFDRFYRADKSRTRASGGSGLGLAIVRSLVALHGGKVEASAEPERGSVFTVTLPLTGRPA